jgi:tetratricopeptide (TPR) repeat protein
LIAAGSILATAIELYGFVKDRKSKNESQTGSNANLTSSGPVGIQQQDVSILGPQTNIAEKGPGDVFSGQFNGPVAAAGGKAIDNRGATGTIIEPSGPVNQHFGDEITQTIQQHVKPPVPQIQAPPQDFVGRVEELNEILSNFERGATITGLRGMGGVGKTALALFLAEKLKDRFPDGQIFLDMQGTSPKPLATADAMIHVIRAYLGAEARLPEDLNGLRGLYNSVLSGKKTLILLDNAASREQVEPLLPPAGSVLLITSRNKFVLPGLKETDLDVLPLIDAKKLLLEIAGRIGEHADGLAKLCGCLPLALRNAASALAEKKNLNVADYVERLKDARKRLDLVEASFSLSYELLNPELQKLWSLLSVFPADFDLAGAAAVWEMESDPAEEALGELVKWSLVDFLTPASGEGGRYHLHDLARVFAGSRLDADACDLAQQCHAEHYKNRLSLADSIFIQGNENFLEGLQLFDQEKANILAGQSWAEKNQKVNSPANELCKVYASVGVHVLDLRLTPRQMIPWMDTGLDAARRSKDNVTEGVLLSVLGLAYSQLGETRKAVDYFNGALKKSREIGDRLGEGAYLGNLGTTYSHLSEKHKAIEYYNQALTIIREIGDRQSEGKLLGNLGNVYFLGETRKAIEYGEQSLKISRETGDRRCEGNALSSLGNAYSYLGENRTAIEYYEQSLKVSREIGDRLSEGANLGGLGIAYIHLGKEHKAIDYCEQSLNISREIGNRQGEGVLLSNLGLAYSNLGEMCKAIEFHELALKISLETEDRLGEGNELCSLGNAYYLLGETRKAFDYYEQSLKVSCKIGDRRTEGSCIFNMSRSLDKLDQRAKAIELAKSALEIFKQIESPNADQVQRVLDEWQK